MTTQTVERTKKLTNRKRMVRKQVYIYRRQDEQLKHLAHQRATTEAELIREAIEGLLDRNEPAVASKFLPPDEAAWQAILAFVDNRKAEGVPGEPYKWKREDGYDDERYQRP
jgi:hypothetical protein